MATHRPPIIGIPAGLAVLLLTLAMPASSQQRPADLQPLPAVPPPPQAARASANTTPIASNHHTRRFMGSSPVLRLLSAQSIT